MDMSNKNIWKIQYVNLCINKFAKHYKMMPQVAYRYLAQYKAIDFLDQHYEAEHVLPIEDTVVSMYNICARNGGTL